MTSCFLKYVSLLYCCLHCIGLMAEQADKDPVTGLPLQISSGLQGSHHVQGIVVNAEKNYVCFSFTTRLIKTDLQGNLIGSVDGLTGHLGCLALNPLDGRIYGSLEYKNDAIGRGIAGDQAATRESAFYIAIFDPDKIVRPGMDAEKEDVMTAVCLAEVADDYYAASYNHGNESAHRYGCSGIDGVMFAPEIGSRENNGLLYVAYGIYGDTTRTDNDYQVLLAYDTKDWHRFEQPLSQQNLHKEGPAAPDHKYFVFTGNTHYGIQNLTYDPATQSAFAAVYRGKKSQYPNYSLFMIDWNRPAHQQQLLGFDPPEEQLTLTLVPKGLADPEHEIYGWNFEWGATGLTALGNGYFYISHPSAKPEQNAMLYLYQWNEDAEVPFRKVEE